MSATDGLVTGDDGLPAREVGAWVRRKVHYVDYYAHLFATGMKGSWTRRAYVELFAGPGRSHIRGTSEYIEGSAIRSLSAEFTDRVFVDIDPVATAALETRARLLGAAPTIIRGNCNVVIDQVIAAIPPTALTLAFVDPTNWQVELGTILRLARERKTDLLVTFMYGEMRRVAELNPPALTTFFGTQEWKSCLAAPKGQVLDRLAGLYNRQLSPVGYLPSFQRREIVKNSKNAELYALLLFTRAKRGVDFWEKTLKAATESGQQQLGLDF